MLDHHTAADHTASYGLVRLAFAKRVALQVNPGDLPVAAMAARDIGRNDKPGDGAGCKRELLYFVSEDGNFFGLDTLLLALVWSTSLTCASGEVLSFSHC